jgi:hypothetical protein
MIPAFFSSFFIVSYLFSRTGAEYVPVDLSLDYGAAHPGLTKIAISGIYKNYHPGQFRA